MKKASIIFIGLCIAGAIGIWIYFVAGVSATFDPIKTYDYSGNVDTLTKRLNEFSKQNKSISFKPTDTTGTEETGHDYYFDLHWVTPNLDTIEYSINLSNDHHKFGKDQTHLKLVEAINLTHLSGGYSPTAKGIKPLVDMFESNIFPHLTHPSSH